MFHWRSHFKLAAVSAAAGLVCLSLVAGALGRPAVTVAITGGPSGTVASPDAVFTFAATGAAGSVRFECALDGANQGCTSPKSYSGLATGVHIFAVTAVDARGGRSVARRTWTIALPPQPPPPPPPLPPPPPTPLPPLPPPPSHLDDKDGVAARADVCPHTPARARALANGCSAVEIASKADLFVEPAAKSVEKARASLASLALLRRSSSGISKDLALGIRRLELGAMQAQGGGVCRGAAAAHAGAELIESSQEDLAGLVATLRRQQGRKAFATRGPEGDTDGYERLWHELGNRLKVVSDAFDAARKNDAALEAACKAVVGKKELSGRVAVTDDAAGLARLDDGRVVSLVSGEIDESLGEGVVAAVNGVAFKDGTIKSTAAAATGPAGGAGPPPALQKPCLLLRIAPVQPFTGVAPSQLTLHHPNAYKPSGLRLEALMRLGVKSNGCGTDAGGGGQIRYSSRIELSYWDTLKQATFVRVLAPDLTDSEHPVPLPYTIHPDKEMTITAKVRSQVCTWVADNPVTIVDDAHNECTKPKALSTETHKGFVIAKGDYFYKIDYGYKGFGGERTSADVAAIGTPKNLAFFGLDDDDLTGFKPGRLLGVKTLKPSVYGYPGYGPMPKAAAEGYLVSNGKSSKPNVKGIAEGASFAIYNADFSWNVHNLDVPVLDPSYGTVGVDHAAGVRWPRAKGFHEGHEYWYLASVPKLVRDAINFCSQAETSSWRLPWQAGFQRKVGQGNNGSVTHHGLWKYAFDFSLADGEPIRAARGGVVVYVDESRSLNTWNLTKWAEGLGLDVKALKEQGIIPPGNELLIRHQDGTISRYVHMQQNQVFVEVGDVVHRGQELGKTGSTGYASGPHVHFEVSTLDPDYSGTIEIRFQTQTGKCKIPHKGDWPMSNNY